MGTNQVAPPPGFVIDDLPAGFVVDEPKKSAPKKEEESPTSFKNLVGAATEPLLQLGTGAVAAPVSGLAGILAGLTNGLGLTNKDPADVVRSVGGAMTYEPKTQGGKNASSVVMAPLHAIGEAADYAGGKTTDITGSPDAGVLANVIVQAIPAILGAKAAKVNKEVAPVVNRAAEGAAKVAGYVPNKFSDVINNITGPARETWRTEQGRQVLEDLVGKDAVPEVRSAVVNNGAPIIPGSPMTVGDRIAAANMNTGKVTGSPLIAVEDALSKLPGGISDIAKSITQQKQAGRRGEIKGITDEALQTVTDQLGPGGLTKIINAVLKKQKDADPISIAVEARKQATIPLMHTELKAANVAGEMLPKLEAQIAQKQGSKVDALQDYGQMATEAAQAGERAQNFTPVAGQPRVAARLSENTQRVPEFQAGAQDAMTIAKQRQAEGNFAKAKADSLEAYGLSPLKSEPILDRIRAASAEPGTSSYARDVMSAISKDIAEYTKGDGVINSYELQRVRKEIGNHLERIGKEKGAQWDKTTAAATERKIQKQIDKAIVDAGGTEWPTFLEKFQERSGPINQMVGGKALEEGLTSGTGKERQAAFMTAVKRAEETVSPKSGRSVIEDFTDTQKAAVKRVSDEILRDVQKDFLGSNQKVDSVFQVAEKGKGGFSVPALLWKPATITNWLMKRMGHGADELIAKDMGRMILENPEGFASKYLADKPPTARERVVANLMRNREAALGATIGANEK